MLFSESVYVALLLLSIVFVVLFGLYLCIKLASFLLGKIQKAQK